MLAAFVFHSVVHSPAAQAQSGGGVLFVAALGVGTKWVDADVFDEDAARREMERVRDSHAEVIARRSLLRFLYAEVALCLAGGRSRVLRRCAGSAVADASRCELRPGLALALYTSTAPCGGCSVAAQCGAIAAKGRSNRRDERRAEAAPEEGGGGCERAEGGAAAVVGTLGRSMSCTDKIVRWRAIGVEVRFFISFLFALFFFFCFVSSPLLFAHFF